MNKTRTPFTLEDSTTEPFLELARQNRRYDPTLPENLEDQLRVLHDRPSIHSFMAAMPSAERLIEAVAKKTGRTLTSAHVEIVIATLGAMVELVAGAATKEAAHSAFDLENEEHRRVLLCICDDLVESTTRDERLDRATFAMPFGAVGGEIFDTLSAPAKAAELIKQLVERAGITPFSPVVTDEYVSIYARTDGIIEVEHEDPDGTRKEWDITEPRKTITRLLSLPPGAGEKAVLAALRGEV